MKMPPGPGTWPAFWLISQKPASFTEGKVEVDVIEYYGKSTSSYQVALHGWYKKNPKKTWGTGKQIEVPDGSLVGRYHTYGADVSPQGIVYFMDRKKVWSQPLPKELDSALYPLVNLALGSGWPIDKTPNPSTLLVDYVHVYSRGAGPPKGCPPGLPAKARR
jgi:beta-glucanase (GH16 family)